jgi:tetratricopeptide (TPR) repeat protein
LQNTKNNQLFNLINKINLVETKKLAIFLFFVSFLLYFRTVNFDFVWDDERIHLTANKELMREEIKSFWIKPYSGMYIPMSYSTWSLIKRLFYPGKAVSPSAFHFLNILFHSINGSLVFFLLILLLKNKFYSFIGALLFLIHPIQVESVAWISEFRGVYSCFFSLMALLCLFHINYNKKSIIQVMLSGKFIGSTFLFLLALLSKPSAITLPYIVMFFALFLQKDATIMLSKCLLLWILLSIPFLFITSQLQPGVAENLNLSFYERIILALNSIFFYLSKLIFPYPLVADYGLTPKSILSHSYSYLIAILVVVSLIFLFVRFKKSNLLLIGIGVIITSLLPVIGFVTFSFQKNSNVADRYIYFGVIGFSLVVVSILKIIPNKKLSYFCMFSILISIFQHNIRQVRVWHDEFSLWDHTLNHFQNSPGAYYNRGVEFSKKENFTEAINDYTNCLRLNPKHKDALFNRINAYENTGDFVSGFRDCETYILIDSLDGSIYFRKARLYYKTGNIQMAIQNTNKAEALGFNIGEKFKNRLRDASFLNK